MPGVQGFLDCLYDRADRDLADDDLYLDLRDQGRVDLNAPVSLAAALLNSTAHDLCSGHSCHAQIVQRLGELVISCQPCDDDDLMHSRIDLRRHRLPDDLDGSVLHGLRRLLIGVYAEICVFIFLHRVACDMHDGESGISACQTVLCTVETGNLLLRRGAQAEDCSDRQECDRDRDCRKCCGTEHSQELYAEKLETAAVEETEHFISLRVGNGISRHAVRREETDRDRSPYPVYTVDRDRTDRIVDPEDIVQEPHAEYDQKSGDQSDHDRTEAVDRITGRCDRDQTCQGSVQTHGDIGLAVTDPGKDHADNCRDGRCDRRRQENASELRNTCRRRAVEAVPAEP